MEYAVSAMRSGWITMPLASVLLLASCTGGAVGDTQPAVDTGSSGQADVSGEALDVPGSSPDVPGSSPDVLAATARPVGPFGQKVGDTVANLDFYNPETEKPYLLYDWFQDPKVKMLMLVSTAAW
jgi:hypothetical protein